MSACEPPDVRLRILWCPPAAPLQSPDGKPDPLGDWLFGHSTVRGTPFATSVEMDCYLTKKQVAETLGVSPSRVRQLVHQGLLRPDGRRSPRGTWLFLPDTVRGYLEACMMTPTKA